MFANGLPFTERAHETDKVAANGPDGHDIALPRLHAALGLSGAHPGGTMGPITSTTETQAVSEKRLWQAVLVNTIQEWISGPLRSKRIAEEYLFQDQKDFPMVCESAGMDAGQLRAKLNRLRARQISTISMPQVSS